MKQEIAQHIARTAFKASRELTDTIPFLKSNMADMECSQVEYEVIEKAILNMASETLRTVLNPIFDEFPEIYNEFDRQVETYGRLL